MKFLLYEKKNEKHTQKKTLISFKKSELSRALWGVNSTITNNQFIARAENVLALICHENHWYFCSSLW